jgi:hypothetical protein
MSLLVIMVEAAEAAPAVRASTAAAEPTVMRRDLFMSLISREGKNSALQDRSCPEPTVLAETRTTACWLPRTSVLPDAWEQCQANGGIVQNGDRSFEQMLKK